MSEMVDKVKLGLLGLVLVISAYSVYQISALKGEINTLKNDLTTNISSLKNIQASNPNAGNANVPPANVNTNPLPVNETKPKGPTTSIKFAEELHHFGTVEVESENKYSFAFTNTGNEPLEITNAKGSCGCTVPQWPKEPIMPGQSANIDVIFTPNAGQAGQEVEKVVTVTANTAPENTMVRIKANVIAKQ